MNSAAYPDPGRFEAEIRQFEEAACLTPAGAVVFYGSSSIRVWHDTLAADLAPLTVVPRGFGGSNMNDALHFLGRAVLPCRPRAIVLYEGDNDHAQGVAPETVAATFRVLVGQIHAALPACRLYALSIKPSIARRALWSEMARANRLLADLCAGDPRLRYVDIAAGMLDAAGEPRKELFLEDNLHMTRAGYEVWLGALKPVLMAAELAFEPLPSR